MQKKKVNIAINQAEVVFKTVHPSWFNNNNVLNRIIYVQLVCTPPSLLPFLLLSLSLQIPSFPQSFLTILLSMRIKSSKFMT